MITGARNLLLCGLWLCGLWLCGLWAVAARADSMDVPRLMQMLARDQDSEVHYTEKKYSALLNAPVASTGTLAYRRPDTVEKNIRTPRREVFRIAGEELILSRNGAERRVPLSSQPLLAALAASLRGLLMGDAQLLGKYFSLKLQGEESAWRLELAPLDPAISRYVERIAVSGRAGRIDEIETREASGDRSVLQLR